MNDSYILCDNLCKRAKLICIACGCDDLKNKVDNQNERSKASQRAEVN